MNHKRKKEKSETEPATTHVSATVAATPWKAYIIPALSLLCFFFLFFEMYHPKINDPWYDGVALCSKSKETTDSVLKKQYLSEGGNILREQNKLHPYHARVWYLLGYYYLLNNQLDSTVYCEVQALEIGAGGIVNQVEGQASELLNTALTRQLGEVNFKKDLALPLIEKAVAKNYDNPIIYKYRGQVYANASDFDLAVSNLQKYMTIYPNDFVALYSMAVAYLNHQERDKALEYALKAQKVNPNNPNLNNMINSLK